MRQKIGYVVFLASCVLGLLLFSGCSIAPKAPESYLTEEYYTAPVLATVAQSVDTVALPTSFDRVTATPVKPAKGKPPKSVHINQSAAAATQATSSETTSSTKEEDYPDKTYSSDSVIDDKKATYKNVEVSAADVVLKNKYIKGNLTVTRDAFYSLTLENCMIEGELIVNSSSLYDLILTDCGIQTLRLASGDFIDVELEGLSYINETVLSSGTKASLYAYNIQSNYSGYKTITIAKSSSTIELFLYGVECKTISVNTESEVTLSDSDPSYVDTFVANAPVTVQGASRIDRFYVRSKGVVLYGEPKELIYDKSKYTVEYM